VDLRHLYKKCMHQFIHAYTHIHDNRCKHIGLNTCIRVKIHADLIAGIRAFIRPHTRDKSSPARINMAVSIRCSRALHKLKASDAFGKGADKYILCIICHAQG